MSVTATIRIQQADFDVAQEIAVLTKGRTDIGAVVSFSGICRGSENGEPIAALTLEHYPGMAEAEIGRHAEEALSRWPLQGLTIIHRFGRIAPGENIVLVVTTSSHRQAAFEAAEFLMDYLKTNAPFWKREESEKGTSWVEARDHDEAEHSAAGVIRDGTAEPVEPRLIQRHAHSAGLLDRQDGGLTVAVARDERGVRDEVVVRELEF